MSAIRFIEDFRSAEELVQELNSFRGSGLVLCSKEMLKSEGISIDKAINTLREYDFGGEADIWVDLELTPNHLVFTKLKEKSKHG